ncbi:MAG: alpha-amylase [Bacteroidetes bacterium]|nr:alpha-amylase [Bacteroidota bacterium]
MSIGILTALISCQQQPGESCFTDGKEEIFGLASPVVMEPGGAVVCLTDYFNDCTLIDSVTGHSCINAALSDDKRQITLKPERDIPHISELRIWIGGVPYTLLVKKSGKIRATIGFASNYRKTREVFLAGEMNNWNPEDGKMQLNNGIWEAGLWLNPGSYQYQLVVDGRWMLDPSNPDSADNNIGGYNSVLTVKEHDDCEAPILYTDTIGTDAFTIGVKNNSEDIFVLWQNFSLNDSCVEKINDCYRISIPQSAEYHKRSWIRIVAYNNGGISNDLLIPLEGRSVVTSADRLTRFDRENTVMYFMLVDRFCNGNKANDDPVRDSAVASRANYYGGDLAGIRQKVKDGYFSEMGINTIWLSPIVQNPDEAYTEYPAPHRKYSGYHGYWPVSSTTIDHRFGTSEEFSALVDEAHTRNISVIIDFVANHVHEKHPLYVQHPEWVTQLDLPDGRKNIRLWDEYRLTTWFDTFLPSLDFSKPEVVELQSDSAMFWLQKYGIDGFRHDATKHIPEVFWRTLTEKIKKRVAVPEKQRFYQIGETFGSRELIGSYVGSGMMDGQFDFNLYFDARSVFAVDSGSFKKLHRSVSTSLTYYGSHNLMGNITGNHDIPRFISYAGEGLHLAEDEKEAGWQREIKVENPVGYMKLTLLTTFIMTIPGVPVIYYGDEIGMPGAGDPDNRRPMKFGGLTPDEIGVKEKVKKLAKLRTNRISLIFGDFEPLYVSQELYVYARTFFDEITLVAFNKSNEGKSVTVTIPARYENYLLKAHFGSEFNVQTCRITIKLAPYSFEILTN